MAPARFMWLSVPFAERWRLRGSRTSVGWRTRRRLKTATPSQSKATRFWFENRLDACHFAATPTDYLDDRCVKICNAGYDVCFTLESGH